MFGYGRRSQGLRRLGGGDDGLRRLVPVSRLSHPWPASAPAGRSPAPPTPRAAGRRDHLRGRASCTVSSVLAPPATRHKRESSRTGTSMIATYYDVIRYRELFGNLFRRD